ncbi:MAG TPA: thiamine-binding protein [Salinivirga sp.]|uniref:thiamine-binding protein n=1 Tax=Salinivirga sp. TaxID=1970192 RepID=UPI002B45CFE4|nr:thiamine-binding protein [Salinivirga sp.]HKK60871.1 thiamine-binding protein [Salinivirga sp.]
MNKINFAIQVLPQGVENVYEIVDKAIAVIERSGVKYRVCPFETVIETTWENALQILTEVKEEVLKEAPSTLINLKIQAAAGHDVVIEDKTDKYDG